MENRLAPNGRVWITLRMDSHTGLCLEINGELQYVAVLNSKTGKYYTPSSCLLTDEAALKAIHFATHYNDFYGDIYPINSIFEMTVLPAHWSLELK